MSSRNISRNPSLPETRLHCLDMAVRGAQLTGRTNDLMQIADQYFDWVMRGTQPVAPTTQTPSGSREGADDDDSDDETQPIGSNPPPPDSNRQPASLRQAGGQGTKDAGN